MRLVGSVEISDYFAHVKLQQGDSVAVLHSVHGEDLLIIRNPQVKATLRYKISNHNVMSVSTGGPLSEKLTIVFQEPHHELVISNKTHILERFAQLIMELRKPRGPSERINARGIPRQLQSINSLPQTLTELKIYSIQMDSLPVSLARLNHLVILEVVNCNLTEIPVFVGDYPNLSQLVLTYNKLAAQINWEFLTRPSIRQNLQLLDLRSNELQNVPNEVLNLNDLQVCMLDDNQLISLPTSLRHMFSLRYLGVSSNMMRIFPYNIFPLNGLVLNVAKNPFISRYFVIPSNPQAHEVLTLKELAARVVVNYRLPWQFLSLPQNLVDYLKKVRFCAMCSGAFFDVYLHCCYLPHYRVYIEIFPENRQLIDENFILNLCSRMCMQPELKFCEVLSHLTPEQYNDWLRDNLPIGIQL